MDEADDAWTAAEAFQAAEDPINIRGERISEIERQGWKRQAHRLVLGVSGRDRDAVGRVERAHQSRSPPF